MTVYHNNLEQYSTALVALEKKLNKLSLLRLAVFLISCALIIFFVSTHNTTPIYAIVPMGLISFSMVIKRHARVAALKRHTFFLKHINEEELKRFHCELNDFDQGQRFIDPNHPYTGDLDIFGQHSIFQLVNRTTTESGMIMLSKWLSQPAAISVIGERQKAIQELAEKLTWRQDFQACGQQYQNKKSAYHKLLQWVEKPNVLLKNQIPHIAAAIGLPVVFFLCAYFLYQSQDIQTRLLYFISLLAILFINSRILKKISPQAEDIVETSTANLKTLRGYKTLITKIEFGHFSSNKLSGLQSTFTNGHYSASREINTLCRLLDFSHQRPIKKIPIGGNLLYPILNSLFLIDIYLILGTEKWKLKNQTALKSWADVVSEFEVINSFSGFYYSNPNYTFPVLTNQPNTIDFKQLGHPLIRPSHRICNDFSSKGHGDVVMVTGSNMGGKSTFLRTVGINVILGLAGAPCCAISGQISHLKVFTSMRTQDNLLNGISSFYAELRRMEKMLHRIENEDNVYFLLDEIFKGTNSEDRHKGGYSLIHQLSTLKTSGIIATHDIELAKLAGDKNLVTNYSFNSVIKEDTMVFSYTLDPTICTDFNASELMKRSGIKVLSNNMNL